MKHGAKDPDVPGVVRMHLVDWALLSEITRLRALRLGVDPDQGAVVADLVRRAAEDELPRRRGKGRES